MHAWLFRDSGMSFRWWGVWALCLVKIIYLEAMYVVNYGLESMYIVNSWRFQIIEQLGWTAFLWSASGGMRVTREGSGEVLIVTGLAAWSVI